jgi:putative acetyltransferase
MAYQFREVQKKDNPKLSKIIKDVFREFHADKPGTVFYDPSTNHLFNLFQDKNAVLWVAEINNEAVGCCGIYPTEGLPYGCTELVKFYLSSVARGKGIGRELMRKCESSAKELGYQQIYIESLPEFNRAVGMYEKAGYQHLKSRMGHSGHFGCDIWMAKGI